MTSDLWFIPITVVFAVVGCAHLLIAWTWFSFRNVSDGLDKISWKWRVVENFFWAAFCFLLVAWFISRIVLTS